MTLQPDTTILNGQDRIIRIIGEGRMARVCRGGEPKFGCPAGLAIALDLIHKSHRGTTLDGPSCVLQ